MHRAPSALWVGVETYVDHIVFLLLVRNNFAVRNCVIWGMWKLKCQEGLRIQKGEEIILNLSLSQQDLWLGWSRRDTCCLVGRCVCGERWFALLVFLLVSPFFPHLCRLPQRAAFLLWVPSRPSSEFSMYYLCISTLQFCTPTTSSHLCGISILLTEQRFEFSCTQYPAACPLWIGLESWKISKVLCQSSSLSLAQKGCWDVGFL